MKREPDVFSDRAISAIWSPLPALFCIIHHIGEIIVRGIERLHLVGAVVALVARRDASLVRAYGLDDLCDGGGVAAGDVAAIGMLGVRRRHQRQCNKARLQARQSGLRSVRIGNKTTRLTLGSGVDISRLFPFLTR